MLNKKLNKFKKYDKKIENFNKLKEIVFLLAEKEKNKKNGKIKFFH